MAGPDRPLWVNSTFSRKCTLPMRTSVSSDTPASGAKRAASSTWKVSGTSAGSSFVTGRPNCSAIW
ncbi:hypothetical protein D3C72_2208020 [compost metagenome]